MSDILAEKINIREIKRDEWEDAMALCWRVFLEFEAGSFGKEGAESFSNFLHDDVIHTAFMNGGYPVFGAYNGMELVGVASVRRGPHLSLLFVDAAYHHNHIATRLIMFLQDYLLNSQGELGKEVLTVNSSPYAVGFYHRLGFRDTDAEQHEDGIIYTPMEFYL